MAILGDDPLSWESIRQILGVMVLEGLSDVFNLPVAVLHADYQEIPGEKATHTGAKPLGTKVYYPKPYFHRLSSSSSASRTDLNPRSSQEYRLPSAPTLK